MTEQRRRGDTRERIQAVAVRMFAQRGYDNTSLREIAEELGVTKAALYYHFKTKEDLATSLVTDMMEKVDAIITWAEERPATPDTRHEIVRRFHGALYGVNDSFARDIQRFIQTNQQLIQERVKVGEGMRGRFKRLGELLIPAAAPPAARLKATMALFTLFAARGFLDEADITPAEQSKAALKVALDLIGSVDRY
jgi:AcrR family transcriptional regulator